MVDVVRHHERMIGVGPNARIEQGPITWVIYTRESTGVEIVDGKVTKAGCHPIVKNNNGDPAETNETHVWVPKSEAASEDEALGVATTLAQSRIT